MHHSLNIQVLGITEYVLNSYSYKFGIFSLKHAAIRFTEKETEFLMRIHMTVMLHCSKIPSKLCVTVGFHIKLVYADCMN